MTTATGASDVSEERGYIHVRQHVSRAAGPLRLLCMSDTHDLHADMPHGTELLPRADILVHAGDFTCTGRREEVESFNAWIDALLAAGTVRHVVLIAGNHECSFALKAKHPTVRAAQLALKASVADSRPDVHYLEDSACEVCGLTFFGSPWTSCTGDSTWAFQAPESQLSARFGAIPDGVDVLVTHSPPLGVGDGGDERRHGSASLLRRVQQLRPLLHVFGHIHGGAGVFRQGDLPTAFVNAAVCDNDYRPVQKPILVELVPRG